MDTGTEDDVSAGTRSFSDLPSEILSSIANRLPVIDLLSFRGTCNDFRSASSTASAATDSYRRPWLLLHKSDTSDCLFYNDEDSKTYNRDIPDLKNAVCLASHDGWLLLSNNESIFFFNPFSLAKINLPDFPHKQIAGHVAAFSNVPTSSTCTVSVINRTDDTAVEVNVISKGQTSWTPHKILSGTVLKSSITGATFDPRRDTFYYMDDGKSYIAFSVKEKTYTRYRIVPRTGLSNNVGSVPYCYSKQAFRYRIDDAKMRERFNLEDDEYVVVCGLSYGDRDDLNVYLNEVVDESPTKTRVRRAVWIQPRFFAADPNLRW